MKRLKKVSILTIFLGVFLLMAAAVIVSLLFQKSVPAAGSAATPAAATPSYCTVTEVFDWGPAVTKIILPLGKTVAKGSLGVDTFSVHVVRTDPRPGVAITGNGAEGDRPVTKAYASDKDGNAAESGDYATLEMQVGPDVSLGYPINYDQKSAVHNVWNKCDYTVTQKKDIVSNSGVISGLVVNKRSGDVKKLVDDFKTGSYSSPDQITLTYASFEPAKDNHKNPLIVWLHGLGEIGTDPTIPISANKSCRFASPEVQSYFSGAYVLSPQCPVMWTEGSEESALMALIKDYASKNSDIDTNRIYVGGNSNGGYMTMLLARDYSDYFAAAMPVCEALADASITDADILKLKNTPIWLTAAKTDTIVPPENFAVPTYRRLKKAGAKNVHFSYFDNVVDMTGLYKKVDGTPYEYNGHFSFYYVFNNQCIDRVDGKNTAIMQWLSAQSK